MTYEEAKNIYLDALGKAATEADLSFKLQRLNKQHRDAKAQADAALAVLQAAEAEADAAFAALKGSITA